MAAVHYPLLPARYLMRPRLPAVDWIGRYHGPFLQSHVGDDSIIPIALGRRLFTGANEPQ